MDLCNESCSSEDDRTTGPPSVLCGKNFQRWMLHANCSTNLFIPDMLLGTFYNIPLSLTLNLLVGHKVTAKQNLSASFSPTF